MLILLSPSKTMSFHDAPSAQEMTEPRFLREAEQLMKKLKRLSPGQIEKLMKANAAIAAQAADWFHNWAVPFTESNAKPAVNCFKGAVYTGLDARNWTKADQAFAQEHLRILSGLYGVLKPLDGMQPYRLEMGLKWDITPKTPNLYAFWGTKVQREVEAAANGLIINLASTEYSKAALPKSFDGSIITPVFKELVGDAYKAKMAYAKEARGTMARHIVQNRWTEPEALKTFTGMGYSYHAALSNENEWIFTRDTSKQNQ